MEYAILDTSFSPSSPSSVSSLITAARSSYSKLVSRLQTEFTATQNEEDLWRDGYASYRGDLMFILGQGLHRLLTQIGKATQYASSQGLSEAKMELRRQEHALRQMTKQMNQLEADKRSLMDRVSCADKTMTSTAR
ncbi:predicted protein [Nematostella vectensis]|uniref:Uncharacterized protein n=1 Tax=Nematostella vectensis TaxID=45351 RepID=A7TBE5_NEMVE|nr:predicted protein [Nematostella vectensis]|eukprot:XP_001618762.1 hypothetical protein NEMVEDRAFT_v1g224838 [Nematostella vectensis]